MNGYWRIHPDFQDQGLEERLAEWIEERARRGVPLALPGARVALIHRFIDLDKTAERVLLSRGYRIVRRLVRMTADLNGSQGQDGPGVEGIRLLPLIEVNKEEAVRALYEAFRDHWGAAPESFEQYRRRTLHFFDRPEVSPALSLAAVEGEEVVAAAVSSRGTAEDARMGWVNMLGVRRAWRKRGVGEALLRRSFAGFRAQGLERAGLNVDAESLTGATRLYQKVGMAVTRCYLTYELELRPGEDLTVREIGV
jgi:ribosomal protein S18 acetylase RimI-like enzyme